MGTRASKLAPDPDLELVQLTDSTIRQLMAHWRGRISIHNGFNFNLFFRRLGIQHTFHVKHIYSAFFILFEAWKLQ